MLFLFNNEYSLSFFFQLLLTIHLHFLLLHLYPQYFKIRHIPILKNTYHESFSLHRFLIFKYLQNISLNEVKLFEDPLFLIKFLIIHHLKENKILGNWFFYLLNKNLNPSNILLMMYDILLIYLTFFYSLYIQSL